jgi:hypothetical protein
MEDHDLWITFFKDPAGNTLALIYVLGSATVFLKFYLFAVRFAFAARAITGSSKRTANLFSSAGI